MRKRRIGECWHEGSDKETGHFNVFISPGLGGNDVIRVLDVLVHELVHVVAPQDSGHRAGFSRIAKAVGLEKPWTATRAGVELTQRLNAVSDVLGPYPHGAIVGNPRRKVEATRMLKASCAGCGYTVRVAQKWLDVGCPICPECREEMEQDGGGGKGKGGGKGTEGVVRAAVRMAAKAQDGGGKRKSGGA